MNVTVQSGVNETDNISDNPNANVNAPIFGYGTSATSTADQFTFGGQTISAGNSTASFASPSVNAGAADVLTIVVKDTNNNGVGGLNSSAFVFAGVTEGTFGAVSATTTPGTYIATFTGATAGGPSSLTVTVNGIALAAQPSITVTPLFAVISPSGIIAAAAGFDTPAFNWTAYAGANHYYLRFTDRNTNTLPIVVPNIIGTSYVPTAAQALTPGHSFTIYVYAMNSSNLSIASATQTFSLSALAAPTGLTPSGTVAAASGFDIPAFHWNASTGASHYNLIVHDHSTTSTNAISVTGLTATSYTAIQALTPGHTYTMYVYAVSTNGLASAVATQIFSLAALAAPTGLTPNATLVAASGFDLPTFHWNAATGANRYNLIVHDHSTTSTNAISVTGLNATSYIATQALTPGDVYTIYVYAVSTNGLASAVATQTFSLAALAAPTGLIPSGALVAASGSDTPTFHWNASTGAGHYNLIVHDHSTTSTNVISVTGLTATSYTVIHSLTPGHTYTLYVYAVSTNGLTSAVATQIFSLASLAAPTLASPIGLIGASPSAFTWSTTPGADHYYLYVVDDRTGAVVINNADLAANSFDPAAPLTVGHQFTWRVAAVSTNDLDILWSVSQAFTIA